MPEPASANDIYQVRVRGHIEGQETNNLFYFSANTATTDVELHLILVLLACFVTELLPVLSNKFTLQDAVWKKIYPTLGVENVTIPPGTLTGGVSSDSVPSFVSAVTSIRTAQGGRSRRGRFYLAGVPESATIASVLDTGSAFWTGFVAFLACLASNFIIGDPPAANSFSGLIYSRKLSGTHFPISSTVGFTPITSWKPVQALGTTRSRKIGRGA